MMRFTKLVSTAALLAGYVSALPRPDSSSGDEVAVSAPYGTILSDTAALSSAYASATASASASYASAPPSYSASSAGSGYAAAYSSAAYSAAASSAVYSVAASSSASYYASTSTDDATSVSTSWSSSQTSYGSGSSYGSGVSYGSGSSSWNGYESCVQQCIASYGPPPAEYTPTATGGFAGVAGTNGVTHTVIVAPTQGVLRYVPFAVNASVGDTVKFMWGANNHTVTKSSELTPCNKTDDQPFASGEQNANFVFEQVVNDTTPIFFYCGTPTHCQKGMFGIINPPSSAGSNTSVGSQLPSMVANSSDLYNQATSYGAQAANNSVAASWGANIDLAQLPSWAHEFVASNVYYTRAFLGQNEDVIQSDGTVNLTGNGSPFKLPVDVTNVLDTTPVDNTTDSSSSASSISSATSTSTSASASATGNSNGAGTAVVSTTLLGLAAVAGAFLAL